MTVSLRKRILAARFIIMMITRYKGQNKFPTLLPKLTKKMRRRTTNFIRNKKISSNSKRKLLPKILN